MKRSRRMKAGAIGCIAALVLTGCGSQSGSGTTTAVQESSASAKTTAETSAAAETTTAAAGSGSASANNASFTFKVGFENTTDEPIGQGLEKWQELLNEENADVAIELYPNSQLGDKSDLMDSMLMGDNVVTLTDGSFYADYGVPDFSVFYVPFLFDDWDQVWKLVDSEWYDGLCSQLEEKGLHIIASNWIYGARQLMTNKKVESVDDLKGLKIRVPDNDIQTKSFNVLGATSVAMSLGDVYQGLTSKTIDGVENPLATLYGRSFQEVNKYILMTNHVMNSTTWVCSADVWNSLTSEQQDALTKTCEEAGKYNNEVYEQEDANYRKKMEEAGVEVTDLTDEEREAWKEKAQGIWNYADDFKWSSDLKETVESIIAK